MDSQRERRDTDLRRMAEFPWHDEHIDLMPVLRSGYPLHESWGAEAADTIERQAKEIAEFNTEANRLVSVNRALVKDRDKFEADYLKFYDIGHNCSIQLRHAQEERDAALAEVERLKAELDTAREASDRVIERMAGELCSVHAEVELLKGHVAELRDGFDAEQAGIELRRRQDAMGR